MSSYINDEQRLIDEIKQVEVLEERFQRITEHINSCTSKTELNNYVTDLHNYVIPNLLSETKYHNLWDEAIFVSKNGQELLTCPET